MRFVHATQCLYLRLAGRQASIVFGTSRRRPVLSRLDQYYLTVLRALGARATTGAWNSIDDWTAFRDAEAVVIRGSWDYHDDIDACWDWLPRFEPENVRLLNEPTLVNRFLDRNIFADLAGYEVGTPRCHVSPPDDAAICP